MRRRQVDADAVVTVVAAAVAVFPAMLSDLALRRAAAAAVTVCLIAVFVSIRTCRRHTNTTRNEAIAVGVATSCAEQRGRRERQVGRCRQKSPPRAYGVATL